MAKTLRRLSYAGAWFTKARSGLAERSEKPKLKCNAKMEEVYNLQHSAPI